MKDMANIFGSQPSQASKTSLKFSAFLLDLDGTILDTIPDLAALTNRILLEMGYPQHSTEEITSFVGSGVRRLLRLSLPKDAPDTDVDHAMDLWMRYFKDYWQMTFPYPGITHVLDEITRRGFSCGVVSNKLQEGVDVVIEKRLPGYFKVLLGDRPGRPRKPDPSGILEAMEMLGLDSLDTVYIGDSPGDVKTARAAGVSSIAVLWGYRSRPDFCMSNDTIPDAFAEKPTDLLQYIR